MESGREQNTNICHSREGSLDLSSKCRKKKEEEEGLVGEGVGVGEREEGKGKEKSRKFRNCLGGGGSTRDEMSAFGFRHNEFEDMVSFTMKCGCDGPAVFWEHRTRTWRRCQSQQ